MKPNPVEVGARIRVIRLSRGLTMREFGNHIFNAADTLVSRWESGKSLPNAKRTEAIANFGEMTVEELLHGKREEVEATLANFTTDELLDEIKRRLNA